MHQLLLSHPDGRSLLLTAALALLAALLTAQAGLRLAASAPGPEPQLRRAEMAQLQQAEAELQERLQSANASLPDPEPQRNLMDRARSAAVQVEIQSATERADKHSLQLELLAPFNRWLDFRQQLVRLGIRPIQEVLELSNRPGLIRVRGLYTSVDTPR